MILYRHPRTAESPSAPPWLADSPHCCYAETNSHRLCGLGPAFQMGDRLGAVWIAVDLGWEALHVTPDEPMATARRITWAKVRMVADAEGRQWQVPVILTPTGNPAIVASIGENWLPVYTPEQKRLLEVTEAALTALEARDLDVPVACQWAAEALQASHHITVQTIQRLHLMDTHLATNVLMAMTGKLDAAELFPQMVESHG